MLDFKTPPPLSLYIHIPWCVKKCPYCDFNSHAGGETLPEKAYVDALISDLEQDLPAAAGRPIESIFVGGGTPSLFSGRAIDRLLTEVRARLRLVSDCEITLEANPGTVEASRFRDFRAVGVNRLSIGVQSFSDVLLARIGRIHDGAAARRAVEAAQAAGFANFNLDLMYGLPGQSLADALSDIDTALALGAPHLSHYQLTLEPNTLFYSQPPTLPGEDDAWLMQDNCQTRLAGAGFEHYEVSAYARATAQCAHNLNYWRFGDYLGVGAGAHAKLTDISRRRVLRSVKHKHPRRYLATPARRDFVMSRSRVSADELSFEFMLNALRLVDGFSAGLFEARTGLALDHVGRSLEGAESRGLLQRDRGRIVPTELGRRFLNDLTALFLPPGDTAEFDPRPRADAIL